MRTPEEKALRWAQGAYWKELAERTIESLGKDVQVARVTLCAYAGSDVPSKIYIFGAPSFGNEYFFLTCRIGNETDTRQFLDWVHKQAEHLPDAVCGDDQRVGECVPT